MANAQDYMEQPFEVSLETIAKCNAACTFCPYPTLERIGTRLPTTLLHRLVGEMADFRFPFFLSPFKVNEPFLDNRLHAFVEVVNTKVPQARIRLFTNGSALTEHHITCTAQHRNIEHLWISLNSHQPEEYKRLMSLDFDKTTARLDSLHQWIERGDFPHHTVVSKVSGQPMNEQAFKDYVSKRWPKFLIQVIKRDGWLGFTDPWLAAVPDAPCLRWFELSVMANGLVSLCCMDGKGEYVIGDLNKQTLLEVYNGEDYKRMRLNIATHSRRHYEPCKRCTY